MGDLGRNLLFAMILVAFTLPAANAGFVEVYLNNSEDLVTAEEDIILKYGKDFTLTFHVGGPYRIESGDDNLSVYSINVDVIFLSDIDRRDPCTMCAIPSYQPLGDTDEDPGYDEYIARFYSDSTVFEGYSGDIRFSIIMKNRTGELLQSASKALDITIGPASSGDSGSSGFSIPELPPVIEDNLLVIGGGLLVFIVLAVGIYTFILAPEDTTADLYKEREYVDPLSKSLTGVGYDSDLPGEEEDEEEYDDDDEDTEDLLDEEEEEFDESKLLAELTSTQKLQSDDEEEEEEEPEPPKPEPKKAVKKKVVRKTVSKRVVRKAAPPEDAPKPKKPQVNMGAGIVSVTCPACEKIHNIDDKTIKFICGCGRRIRVN